MAAIALVKAKTKALATSARPPSKQSPSWIEETLITTISYSSMADLERIKCREGEEEETETMEEEEQVEAEGKTKTIEKGKFLRRIPTFKSKIG